MGMFYCFSMNWSSHFIFTIQHNLNMLMPTILCKILANSEFEYCINDIPQAEAVWETGHLKSIWHFLSSLKFFYIFCTIFLLYNKCIIEMKIFMYQMYIEICFCDSYSRHAFTYCVSFPSVISIFETYFYWVKSKLLLYALGITWS